MSSSGVVAEPSLPVVTDAVFAIVPHDAVVVGELT